MLKNLPTDLDQKRLPSHIAVIMDGNGRWAKNRGLPRIVGHQRGVGTLKDLLRYCRDLGIPALTAYAFSTENWGRPLQEVEFLMALFETVLHRELQEMMAENVKIRFVGNLEELPSSLQSEIFRSMKNTENNTNGYLVPIYNKNLFPCFNNIFDVINCRRFYFHFYQIYI